MSQNQRSFFKDLQNLYKTINDSTDGQAAIIGVDDMSVRVSLQPKSGNNAHAEFLITMKCCDAYPREHPDSLFHTPIYHPNIDVYSGWICCSIFNNWSSCYSLLDVVKAMLYLIEHPNFGSPNNDYGMSQSPRLLRKKTIRLLAGLPVQGRRFAPNIAWCQWARANGCLPASEDEDVEEEEEEKTVEGNEDLEAKAKDTDLLDNDDEKTLTDLRDESFYTHSETIPSFAKARHSIRSDDDGVSVGRYMVNDVLILHEAHRVIVWHSGHNADTNTHTTYYFIELCGGPNHRAELGELYSTLFLGNVSLERQIQQETRQRSSYNAWYDFRANSRTISYDSHRSRGSSVNLEGLFAVPASDCVSLTRDFCPWSRVDGKGTIHLFDGIFFEKKRDATDFRCFLDVDSDADGNGESDGSSQGIGKMFNCSYGSEVADWEVQSAGDLSPENGSLQEERTTTEEPDEIQRRSSVSTVSKTTYQTKEDEYQYSLMKDCRHCLCDVDYAREYINKFLSIHWNWSLRQTRWSIRFAPQQNVDLSMRGIFIPPWRGSSARLMSDMCQFCQKNTHLKNVVLLDPMTLSPLSPILNLMQHHKLPESNLTGVLWMTLVEALSPFYRVPVPILNLAPSRSPSLVHLANPVAIHGGEEEDKESRGYEEAEDGMRGEGGGEEERGWIYPSASCLRFLVLNAFLTNWVSWLSRMEVYSSLGQSRHQFILISDSVAISLLQPYTLGCGAVPLLDVWPLWLFRRLLAFSLRLAHFPFFRPCCNSFRFLFPFSDLDEI